MRTDRRVWAAAAAAAAVAIGAAVAGVAVLTGGSDPEHALVARAVRGRHLNQRAHAIAVIREKLESQAGGGEADRRRGAVAGGEVAYGPAQEQYDDRAFPHAFIRPAQARESRAAFRRLRHRVPASALRAASSAAALASSWQELGPSTLTVPAAVTYTGAPSTDSGRVTALAIDPNCVPGACRLWVAAAGGGIWRTPDAFASTPTWTPVSNGLTSTSIGSLIVDPTDGTGNTLYAGTGEENGSGDSEAGVGLFRSTDGGDSWSLLPGSVPVSLGRGIGAVAVDPAGPGAGTIYIGTDVARHGLASVQGGRRTPPGAPPLGVYRSTDGGATFTLAFSQPGDGVAPAGGSDYFQGGVNQIETDRTALTSSDQTRIFASLFGYGVFRSSPVDESGSASFQQIFQTRQPASSLGSRSEFALAPHGTHLRMYVGDADDTTSELWFVDDQNVAASALFSVSNVGWTKRSSATNGSGGFASYGFCETQCSYDMFVASPPGSPTDVWIGGSMNYDEITGVDGTGNPVPFRSNGRAVMRSIDMGKTFTDMTDDAGSPFPYGMHPDQHAIAFAPGNAGVAFIGSDGGVVRTSGTFTDASADCASRPDGLGSSTPISGADLTDCKSWLSAVPTRIYSLNAGLATLQLQSLSVDPRNPTGDLLGGTQDNGTLAFGGSPTWVESVGGDGGQSGFDATDPHVRYHTYYQAQTDTNFHGADPNGWDWTGDPLFASPEAQSFYVPLTADPRVSGTVFTGLEHVWRTRDSGGSQAFLDAHCNDYTGDQLFTGACGDWAPLGGADGTSKGNLTGTDYGSTRAGEFVVAVERAPSDGSTLWAATRTGRLFVSKNADAADPNAVAFTRIDTPSTPGRFVSGIQVDPRNPDHAWISYSGYGAYDPDGVAGHVFEATFTPASGTATFVDRSYDIGDQPILDVVRDDANGDLYASTDYGVLRLPAGATAWENAAPGLPPVATYGLTISSSARVLYAATHGRGAWKLALPGAASASATVTGPSTLELGRSLTVDGSGSLGGGASAVTYAWKLPDGSAASGARVSLTPKATGSQTFSLTVTDAGGNTATASYTVRVVDTTRPRVTLAGAHGVAGRAVRVSGRASDIGGVTRARISFGDGRTAKVAIRGGRFHVRHVYRRARRYRLRVSVSDPSGNVGAATARVRVTPHRRPRR